MWRWIAAGALLVLAAAAWSAGLATVQRDSGYSAPVFAPDGASVYALRRDAGAAVFGFGYEFFTPPATVFVHRDGHALINVRLADHRLEVLLELPPSPLEGQRISAYHGSIYGTSNGHLRWSAGQLEYEIAVTRHDTPLSRTFVARGRWDEARRTPVAPPQWLEQSATMGGLEPAQLSGRLEVMAVPGEEGLPCALVTLHRDTRQIDTLAATRRCGRRYRSGLSLSDIQPLSRRAEIERTQAMTRTYAELVAHGVAAGASEGAAMLRANKEMERLGYYRKSTTLTATPGQCTSGPAVFPISKEEFTVGLFPDIAEAIAHPGEEVDKGMGNYIVHDRFETSRRINEFLSSREHTTFHVKTHDACWQVQINRPER